MARTHGGLRVLSPQPLAADERSPLLGESNERPTEEDGLEAQAEQELREHDVASVPVAEEPSTRRLVLTMGSLWLSTFFAALGMYDLETSNQRYKRHKLISNLQMPQS